MAVIHMTHQTKTHESLSKYEKFLKNFNKWTSFYRCNPHRFAVDYFNMSWLKPFQKMLIVLMFRFTYLMTIASRGLGKSQIVAAFCVLWATLYPGAKICIAAGRRGQSMNALKKITEDFMPKSQNLRNEILRWNTSPNDGFIIFKNGSSIKVVTAADSARSARANIIIFDEFRQIKKEIIDKVLKKFKAGQRTPDFYNNPKYKDVPKEPNKEIYLSSAYYKHHWSWNKFRAFFNAMVYKVESYFLCGFPYQLPVSEGYYPAEQIREEMQEDDFDSIGWSMEMDSLFFGSSENAMFSFEDMDAVRKIQLPIYPKLFYKMLNDSKFAYEEKAEKEIRLLSIDVSYIPGTTNDATSFAILQLLPNKDGTEYVRNLIYMITREGGNFFDQSLQARRLFNDFDINYVIIDTNGVGAGLYDDFTREQIDIEKDRTYPAWTCINDEKMASLCPDINALPIIYSIKATSDFNSHGSNSLKDGFLRSKIRFLINDSDASDIWMKSKAFRELTIEDQTLFLAPYLQTTCLVNEMVNLELNTTINWGKTKLIEKSGMRKDRYSSLLYGYVIANELERKLRASASEYDYTFSYS